MYEKFKKKSIKSWHHHCHLRLLSIFSSFILLFCLQILYRISTTYCRHYKFGQNAYKVVNSQLLGSYNKGVFFFVCLIFLQCFSENIKIFRNFYIFCNFLETEIEEELIQRVILNECLKSFCIFWLTFWHTDFILWRHVMLFLKWKSCFYLFIHRFSFCCCCCFVCFWFLLLLNTFMTFC